eukprot:9488449-Pyramimonas_sp.AAC.1
MGNALRVEDSESPTTQRAEKQRDLESKRSKQRDNYLQGRAALEPDLRDGFDLLGQDPEPAAPDRSQASEAVGSTSSPPTTAPFAITSD